VVAGADIVGYALTQRGDPYVWGAEGPNAFDCSGLVEYVYKRFGLTTPRTTADMMASDRLQPITRAQLQPGDLVFSNWSGRKSSHVGIFDGQGNIIEAPAPGQTVTVTKLGPGYWAHTDAYRRVPGVDGYAPAAGGYAPGEERGALDALLTPAKLVASLIPNPGNVTESLTNIGNAMAGVAQGAIGVGNLATLATRAFLPSNLLRGAALIFGTVLVFAGIWFLAREVRE
jgi:hypothetical protein